MIDQSIHLQENSLGNWFTRFIFWCEWRHVIHTNERTSLRCLRQLWYFTFGVWSGFDKHRCLFFAYRLTLRQDILTMIRFCRSEIRPTSKILKLIANHLGTLFKTVHSTSKYLLSLISCRTRDLTYNHPKNSPTYYLSSNNKGWSSCSSELLQGYDIVWFFRLILLKVLQYCSII